MITPQEIADILFNAEIALIRSLKRNLNHHKGEEKKYQNNWQAWQAMALANLKKYEVEALGVVTDKKIYLDKVTTEYLTQQWQESPMNRQGLKFNQFNKGKFEALAKETAQMQDEVWKAVYRQSDDIYRKVVEQTAMRMETGEFTLNKAIDSATKDFLERGYDNIVYSDGRRVNIQSYTEMALRTASKRAKLLAEGQSRERLGIDTLLVSRYGACSKTCLPYQGKPYIDDVYQPFKGTAIAGSDKYAISRNGGRYMRLSYAMKNGLFHPNCRHTVSDYIEGITRIPAPMSAEKIERASALEQHQRALEREVRKYKRLYEGSIDSENRARYKAKLDTAQKNLREFIKENSDVLRRDYWREHVVGID